MVTISILANIVRQSVNRRSDDTVSGVETFLWQDPVHSWKAGPGENFSFYFSWYKVKTSAAYDKLSENGFKMFLWQILSQCAVTAAARKRRVSFGPSSSSVVCSSQSVDCSIQWHSVLVVGSGAPSFFLCRTIQPLYCTVLVSRGSSMVLGYGGTIAF